MPIEPRRGALVFTLFCAAMLTNGANMTEGIFYLPIREEFGFSRTQGATLASTTHLTTGVMLLFAGFLLKRIPPQFMQSAGFLTIGCAYLLTALSHGYSTLLLCYFLIGVGQGLVALLVVSPVIVTHWFERGRSLALAFVYVGTSVGGSAMTAVIGNLVATEGWRTGYTMMSIPMFVIPILLLTFVRLKPVGAAQGGDSITAEEGLTVREGLMTRSFWILIAAFALYMIVSAAVFLHFVPSLIEAGSSPAQAAARMSLLLLAAVPGKIMFGWIGDRFGIRRAVILVLVMAAGALALFASGISTTSLVVFMFCFGLAYSAPLVLIPIALAGLVGRRNLSVFAGITMFFSNTGFSIGPVFGGWLRDSSEAYGEVYLVLAAALLVAAILVSVALREIKPKTFDEARHAS